MTSRLLMVAALCCGIIACGTGVHPRTPKPHIPCALSHGATSMALNIDFQGVWTNPNQHSKVPAGAATKAENVVNPRPGVASAVPGQEDLADTYDASDERFSSGLTYQGCLVESTTGATPKIYVRDPDTLLLTPESGSFEPPADVERIPFAIAGDRLYMATSSGVMVKDGIGSAPAAVGAPQALYANVTGNNPLGSLLTIGQSVAYRYVISRPNAAGIYERGTPSGRTVFTAPGDDDPTVTMYLPEGLTAEDRIEVYRTGIADSGVDPGDTMYMVSQTYLNTSDYALFGTNTLLDDTTPDALRGEPLYTNGTSEGILKQNERPPYAKVMEAFDDSLLLGNVQGPQTFSFRFVGVPTAGDILTIDGVDYEADALPPDGFVIGTGGTVAENIEATARNLVFAINMHVGVSPAREIHAFYTSGPNDPPGMITLEAIDITKTAFTAQASANGERYEPPLTTAQSSLATTEPNGIWVSKRGQHYAFPPLRSSSATYRFRVGVKGNDILAMAHLRDAVIVFVQGEGVFKAKRVGAEGWRVDQINATANLLAPNSVAVLDNQVIALTTRGIVVVDEGGVEEIDLQIKDSTLAMRNLDASLLKQVTFGVADEQRLRYILYHPLSDASTTADHAWVYNAEQGTWTERTDPASGGLMGEDGLLYLGSATSNVLTRERTGTASQVYKRPDNTAIPVRIDWTVMDEGDPGAMKQFQELRLLTKDAITGNVTFACTNDLGGQESTTASTVDGTTGEPYVRAWVPDGCQRTSRLNVSVQRSVLSQAFEVVGMKAMVAGAYNGGMAR